MFRGSFHPQHCVSINWSSSLTLCLYVHFIPNIMSLRTFHPQHCVSTYIPSPTLCLYVHSIPNIMSLGIFHPLPRPYYPLSLPPSDLTTSCPCLPQTLLPRSLRKRSDGRPGAADDRLPAPRADAGSPGQLHRQHQEPTTPTAAGNHGRGSRQKVTSLLPHWRHVTCPPSCYVNSFPVLLTRPVLPTLLPRELSVYLTDLTCLPYS